MWPQRYPKPAFTLAQVQTFNPVLSTGQQWFAGLQFVVLLGRRVSVGFCGLGSGQRWCGPASWSWSWAGVWALGRLASRGGADGGSRGPGHAGRHGVAALLPADQALGHDHRYGFCSYLHSKATMGARGQFDSNVDCCWLPWFSLGGDVFLMLPGDYFIPGLASFLVAHLFYIALFRQGVGWFVQRKVLWGLLAGGADVRVCVAAWATRCSRAPWAPMSPSSA